MLGKGLESLIPPHRNPRTAAASDAREDELDVPRDGSGRVGQRPSAPAPQGRPLNDPAGVSSTPHEEAAQLGTERGVPVAPPQGEPHVLGERNEKTRRRITAEGDAVFHIEVEKIKPNPHQPRKDFHEENLKELADSIREFGIIQPLVVSKVERETERGTDVEYELIAGERRLMAAKLLGLPRVPAVIRTVGREHERLELAVVENLQRQNLNPVETARAMARLQDEFRMTQREIAARIGKSREAVANTVRLLDLPSHIQDALSIGVISETHGRLLLAVEDKAAQEALFRDLIEKHLSTREMKMRVEAMKPPAFRESRTPALPPELLSVQEKLSSELGAPVKIEKHGESGKIMITFYSGEELKNIIERLGGEKETL